MANRGGNRALIATAKEIAERVAAAILDGSLPEPDTDGWIDCSNAFNNVPFEEDSIAGNFLARTMGAQWKIKIRSDWGTDSFTRLFIRPMKNP
ncbi:hypothetical protein EBS80_01015 [bacterium]|nr:hypothetical protein [bacterium]